MLLGLSFGGENALEQKPRGIQEPTLRVNAVDPQNFVRPGDTWTVDLSDGRSPNLSRTPYLGVILLAVSLLGLARRPREAGVLVVVGLGMVLALGPYLWWNGDFYRTASGDRVAMPLRYLLPYLAVNLDHPLRLLGMSITGLAGLAALGAGRAAPVVAILIAAEALLVAPNRWPYATCSLQVPAVYRAIRENKPEDTRALIDLPADHHDTATPNVTSTGRRYISDPSPMYSR